MKQDIIFWNVDTQYDFMRPDGKLPVEGAQSIEPNLEKITKYAMDHNLQVVNTRDWHTKEDAEISNTPDFVATYPEHCMAGTIGADYVPATKPMSSQVVDLEDVAETDLKKISDYRNIVINKNKFDVYAGNKFTHTLVDILDPAAMVVYGVATNVCVDQAVMGHRNKGIDVYVIEDAIKHLPHLDADPVMSKEATLKKWQDNGVQLIQTEQLDSIVGQYR
ncbi:MAG: isochorismatase family protein [Nanoarchaeota archaeon]|nr:isochorismatase family protein [Nanoarchaeota archaeon]